MSKSDIAVVTGGAGLIGSHIVDLLLEKGYHVRVIDSLHEQTHKSGKPNWVPKEVEFYHGDVRNLSLMEKVIVGSRYIFHQAAFGGFTAESSEYFDVNVTGTARIYEALENTNTYPEAVLVASSQAIFGELEYLDPSTSEVIHPSTRRQEDLEKGIWNHFRKNGDFLIPQPAKETLSMMGVTPYALSKIGQETGALGAGRRLGISTACLRYGVTYGPRQSLSNPYTGVISIFSNRLRNKKPPVIYEDGLQVRDFVYVKDQAKLNVELAESGKFMNLSLNSGTGIKTEMYSLAKKISDILGGPEPELSGEYRPGDSRHFFHSTERLNSLGFSNETNLETGLGKFIDWLSSQPIEPDAFDESRKILLNKGVLKKYMGN